MWLFPTDFYSIMNFRIMQFVSNGKSPCGKKKRCTSLCSVYGTVGSGPKTSLGAPQEVSMAVFP